MTKEEIKDLIILEIDKTKKSIEEYKDLTKPVAPDVAYGRITRMDAINNKSIIEAALREVEEKLKKLDYVLSLVDNDDFGLCKKCKANIPIQRIIIKPESLYCVKCAK